MKGDFSRKTFVKEKHYNGVLMQQGRVILDADWNEQIAIQNHRNTAETRDLLGPCGAPAEDPGFQITVKDKTLLIGEGHYYVNGILCENDRQVAYDRQPDLYDPPHFSRLLEEPSAQLGLVYLDVWHRHITRLEDSRIHESALGDADTTTRSKVVWQVKIDPIKIKLSDPDRLAGLVEKRQEARSRLPEVKDNPEKESQLLADLAGFEEEISLLLDGFSCSGYKWNSPVQPGTGKLNARSQQAAKSELPCIVPPGAGYRRLENQLYRVEIHESGTLNIAAGAKKPTFIWSRENGSVVTEWSGQSGAHSEVLEVADSGRDSVLGFSADQWIELTDDKHELDGKPGTLAKIVQIRGNEITIDYSNVYPSNSSIKRSDFSRNPKIRRWDIPAVPAVVAIPSDNDGFIRLGEDGVEIKFSSGTYRTGDYWVIPARTSTGDVEWPPDPQASADPFQLPFGIHHHYCRLAVVFWDSSGKIYELMDCRRIFPPLTSLNQFHYAGGDGQEAMPDISQPDQRVALAEPLRVGVSNWSRPVADAVILFQISKGNGQLQDAGSHVFVKTGSDGIAACSWKLDSSTQDQEVIAAMLGEDGLPLQTPIHFHANLSAAAPEKEQCCIVVDGKKLTLEKAVEYAIRGSVCLCLLPGKHYWEGKKAIKPESNFDLILRGCAGAEVHLKNPVNFIGFGSLVGCDLDFIMDGSEASEKMPAFINVDQCGRVRFENCRFFSNGINGALLLIAGRPGQVYLANNFIDARGAAKKNSFARIFAGTDVARVLDVESPARAAEAAEEISSKIASDLKLDARKALAEKINTATEDNRTVLAADDVLLIQTLSSALTARRANAAAIASAMQNLYGASGQSMVNTALILGSAGKATLIDNQIRGVFALYGPPPDNPLDSSEFPEILKSLKAKEFRFAKAAGELHLRGNQIMQLQLSADAIEALKKQSEPDEVFSVLNCAENTFRQGGNLIAANHFIAASSVFEGSDKNLIGAAVTGSAIFVGNRGPNNDAVLWVYARPNCVQKAPDPQLLMKVEAM